MKPNRKAIKAARNGDRVRLSHYLEDAARRYARSRYSVGIYGRYLKARHKVLRAYSIWLRDRGYYPSTPYYDWASRVASHKRRHNPAYQKLHADTERRSRENAARHEKEVESAALDLILDLI